MFAYLTYPDPGLAVAQGAFYLDVEDYIKPGDLQGWPFTACLASVDVTVTAVRSIRGALSSAIVGCDHGLLRHHTACLLMTIVDEIVCRAYSKASLCSICGVHTDLLRDEQTMVGRRLVPRCICRTTIVKHQIC